MVRCLILGLILLPGVFFVVFGNAFAHWFITGYGSHCDSTGGYAAEYITGHSDNSCIKHEWPLNSDWREHAPGENFQVWPASLFNAPCTGVCERIINPSQLSDAANSGDHGVCGGICSRNTYHHFVCSKIPECISGDEQEIDGETITVCQPCYKPASDAMGHNVGGHKVWGYPHPNHTNPSLRRQIHGTSVWNVTN